MATEDITIHDSRLYLSAMRAGGEIDEKIPHAPVVGCGACWRAGRTRGGA
jgi:hypothetical protein